MNFFQLSASARLQNDFLSTRGTGTVQRIAQVIPAKEQSLPDGVVPDSIQRPWAYRWVATGAKHS
jgi:hypothetical protein